MQGVIEPVTVDALQLRAQNILDTARALQLLALCMLAPSMTRCQAAAADMACTTHTTHPSIVTTT